MNTDTDRFSRVLARFVCIVSLTSVAICITTIASAGIIVDSLQYDGHVRSGGTTGVESHFTSTNFPPPNTEIPLPATGSPPAPLAAAKDLKMTYTSAMEMFNSELYWTGIVQISSATGNVFANPLDNQLTYPVQLDMSLYSDTPGKKLVIVGGNIGIENYNYPFPPPDPGAVVVTGGGTEANPLRIQLDMRADQVDNQNGFVKLHLRYNETAVPEPATAALAAMGMLGIIGLARRRLR